MPNWCEGWVKFRGSKENLMKFIQSEFNGAHPVFDEEFDELIPNILAKSTFLNSLRRAYITDDDIADSNGGICLDEDGVGVFIAKINHAWSVTGQGYPELAEKYKLDIRGKCYECGMNFAEEFEYKSNGVQTLYEVHKFNDYQWECECPTLGG
ncbi:hypothetical protein [uncultured Veillonella sp.]|uniref:hypothetical protein n=1 Tax=uncultured Veillonella sp. TaxID=159268 RepID=UPI00261861D7|nr:hypothetical protein [uncultured Veillonella sp.]